MKPKNKEIEVFLTYSHDSEEHKKWVSELRDALTGYGLTVRLDQDDCLPGEHIKSFAEDAICRSDYVVIIFTPAYKERAESYAKSAGYEYHIIFNDLTESPKTNFKYIPVLRSGSLEISVPKYFHEYNIVNMIKDDEFDNQLKKLASAILSQKHLEDQAGKVMINAPQQLRNMLEETLSNDGNQPMPNLAMAKRIEDGMDKWIPLVFKTVGEENTKAKRLMESKIAEWSAKISASVTEFKEAFGPDEIAFYEEYIEDFRQDRFATVPWTVKSALRSNDADLIRYRTAFYSCQASDLYHAIRRILEATNEYVDGLSDRTFLSVKTPEDLEQAFLLEDDMLLTGVIGKGIRSEFLHRLNPSIFSIMTRRTLWGLFFLADHAWEFLRYEVKKSRGITRISNEYDYDFPTFNFYNLLIVRKLEAAMKKAGVSLNQEFRFGYVNFFLIEVENLNHPIYEELNKWNDQK